MASFYRWYSTAWRLEPLCTGSLLYNVKFPEILILSTSEEWKAELNLKPPNGFEHGIPGLGIQYLTPSFPNSCIKKNRTNSVYM